MSRLLDRLLRIRGLLEEVGRTEFATQTARLRELDEGSERLAIESRRSREEWFRAMRKEGKRLTLEETASSDADRQRERIEDLRPAQEGQVEQARQGFIAERVGRLQIQSLRDAGESVARSDAERREQRQLDDWFLSRRKSEDRGAGAKF